MSRFINFLQVKGIWVVLGHLLIGTAATAIFTALGLVADRFQILGGYATRVFLWQFYLLWSLVRSSFVEYEMGTPVYAGYPYLFTYIIGILSGIPIYTLLSMLIHYVISNGKAKEL